MRRVNEDDGNVLVNACKMAGNLLWRWNRGHVRNGIWKYVRNSKGSLYLSFEYIMIVNFSLGNVQVWQSPEHFLTAK
jgi:hypothetical protein